MIVSDVDDASQYDVAQLFAESERSRTELEHILERISDACVSIDSEGRCTYANDNAARLFDRSPGQLAGQRMSDVFGDVESQPFLAAYRRAMETQEPIHLEEYYAPRERWFENRIFPSAHGLTIFFNDVTERKRYEAELQKVNRALRVLNACNQALVRSSDEKELLKSVCDVLVNLGGFRMAWVGFALYDEARSVEPVAQSGDDEDYLAGVDIVWADEERGRGPTGRAIRERRPIVLNDTAVEDAFAPWRERALAAGFRSSVAIPLMEAGRCIGALNVYSDSPSAFVGEELELLCELAADVAYGLGSIRARRQEVLLEEKTRELGLLLKSPEWPPEQGRLDIPE